MPAYNEGAFVPRALRAVLAAAEVAGWLPSVVVVDDGSTDEASLAALDEAERLPGVRVIHQENAGRFAARARGLREVGTDFVLLLDARVEVEPDSLRQVRRAVEAGDTVWNYDVVPATADLGALFWTGITKVWWRAYFRNRTAVSYGVDDFDRYPKGTTAFFAPRQVLLDAVEAFDSHFEDAALASDDTRMLRKVAEVSDIHLSPAVLCRHHAKSGRSAWLRQCYYRGTTFVDGYLGDARSARGLLAVGSAVAVGGAAAVVVAPRTTVTAGALGCAAAAAGARSCGATGRESLAVGLLSPVFGVGFGAGVLRGLRMAARASRSRG